MERKHLEPGLSSFMMHANCPGNIITRSCNVQIRKISDKLPFSAGCGLNVFCHQQFQALAGHNLCVAGAVVSVLWLDGDQ